MKGLLLGALFLAGAVFSQTLGTDEWILGNAIHLGMLVNFTIGYWGGVVVEKITG